MLNRKKIIVYKTRSLTKPLSFPVEFARSLSKLRKQGSAPIRVQSNDNSVIQKLTK